MTDDEHVALAQLLGSVKARVAISGYHGDLMDEISIEAGMFTRKEPRRLIQ